MRKNGNGEIESSPKRKFLFLTIEGAASDLAWQLIKEGNEVKMYIDVEEISDISDGFVEKVDVWEPFVEWADVIVIDHCEWGKTADKLRKQGKLVIGGSVYTDKLELDREFGQAEMKAAGMGVLPHWEFTDFNTAIEFLKDNPSRYVFKPSGQETLDWDSKSLLFIGQEEDGKDIMQVLEHNKKIWTRKLKRFQLQKYASGVEIAVSAFFNGTDFIYPVNINFEHKKLFPGEIGPYTGEMGTLMFWTEPNKFFETTLGKMKDRLAASGYRGCVDINCIANSRGVYPLEFTTRFGYPTISVMIEGILSPWGEFLYALAKGEPYNLRVKKGFQVGIVVAMPPFPYDDQSAFRMYRDSSVLFKRPSIEGVHLGEVKLVDNDWRLAGESGYALVVTGANTTVEHARANAYRRVENIMLQNMFYRTDIGLKWAEESDKLQTWGVL